MRVVRSLAGVLAGYLAFAVPSAALFALTGQNPHQIDSLAFLVASTAYGAAFALLAGYVAGLIAGRSELFHGTLVGILIALAAIISVVRATGGAGWSQVLALFLLAPAAAVGGMLRERQRERRVRAEPPGTEPKQS